MPPLGSVSYPILEDCVQGLCYFFLKYLVNSIVKSLGQRVVFVREFIIRVSISLTDIQGSSWMWFGNLFQGNFAF